MNESPNESSRQTGRPLVMWHVALHCWVEDRLGHYSSTEVFTVEAPENDLAAAARAGVVKLRGKRPRPVHCGVTHIVVTRLDDDRTPPSQIARQNSLWDEAMGAER